MTRKIALFIPSLGGGGAERVMVSLANEFSDKGFEVDLVLANASGPFLESVKSTVNVVNFKKKRVLMAFLPLVSYLRREQPFVILSALTHANVLSILAVNLARVATRIIVSERSTFSLRALSADGLTSRLGFFLAPKFYRKSDAVVFVSKAAMEDFLRFTDLPNLPVRCVYNPFDVSLIQSRCDEVIDHPWFRNGEPPVILSIGRLNKAKAHSLLIDAFVKVRKIMPVRLLILGEGELRAKLEQQVIESGLTDNEVQFPGFVSNPYPYMSRCGVFVLSSLYEGLPGSLIEAMACGAPVVSTDCRSGPDEILEGGRWGKLVPVGDACRLANAIVDVLDSESSVLPDVRLRASHFAKNSAVEKYLEILGLDRI